MSSPKAEFITDTLLNVLTTEPNLPLYLAFLVSELERKGTVIKEVVDPAYKRQVISLKFTAKDFVANINEIRYPKATRNWGMVTHVAIYDEEIGGNQVLYKSIGSVMPVWEKEVIGFKEGQLLLYTGSNTMIT